MTDVDICNLALGYLGDTATVASINPPEGSAQAQHCARFYPTALKLLLESHDWNFITKRVSLELVGEYDPLYSPWRFAYALPADCNTMISVLPRHEYREWFGFGWDGWFGLLPVGALEFERERRRNFQIEVNASGQQVILCDAYEAVGRYTGTEVQAGVFPALFADALAWKLASMLAGPLMKGDAGAAMAGDCLKMHMLQLGMAKLQDANQQRDVQDHVPAAIRARA